MMKIKAMDPAQEFEAKLLTRMKPLNEITARGTSAVQQFYSGATVFLTGGSGFLGKQLIEKLLRATNVSKIFILLRSKKGKSILQRWNEILQDHLYDTLREQQPNFAEKLVPVSGDIVELKLGLSEEDWSTITEQVNVVFHLAATTNFDETLRVATLINVRGTREALLLGKSCKELQSFVYVSTAFSHATLDRIDTDVLEDFYASPISPNALIQTVETVEEERIINMTPSLLKNWVNTYSFSKSVAEELVNTIGNDLPVCVVRPAVVACTKLEPTPGWIDMSCIYGVSGIVAAGGLGIAHICKVDKETRVELVPVDYVNNTVIAAGWETARKRVAGEHKTKIYAISPFSGNPVNNGQLFDVLHKKCRPLCPSPKTVGYPIVLKTKNLILFWICFWLLQLIPAYIIDGICVIFGKQRRFVKLGTKMYKTMLAVSPFACNQWKFDDQNTIELYESLSKEDKVIFNFNMTDIDWTEFIITWAIGLRKYVLKDGLKDTLYARKKITIFKILMFIILPLYIYSLYKFLYSALALISTLYILIN